MVTTATTPTRPPGLARLERGPGAERVLPLRQVGPPRHGMSRHRRPRDQKRRLRLLQVGAKLSCKRSIGFHNHGEGP